MKLGMEVGLGPGHIDLDGDPPALSKRDTAPNFRLMSDVAKWLDGKGHSLPLFGPRQLENRISLVRVMEDDIAGMACHVALRTDHSITPRPPNRKWK